MTWLLLILELLYYSLTTYSYTKSGDKSTIETMIDSWCARRINKEEEEDKEEGKKKK